MLSHIHTPQTQIHSHYIHSMSIGDNFPLVANPLKNNFHVVDNDSGGIALSNINVKLVPTKYSTILRTRETYQMSVTDHLVQPETLASQGLRFQEGIAVMYDFIPLSVHHQESRDNILVFLSSLVSIVGGVFVTVSNRIVDCCIIRIDSGNRDGRLISSPVEDYSLVSSPLRPSCSNN